MSERRSRHYRRVAQACENCRRKKIRCPGQKPNCSACSRLNQECCYKQDENSGPQRLDRRMSDRLSRVEERLDQIFDSISTSRPAHSTASAQEATPASTAGVQHAASLDTPVAWSTQTFQGTTPKEFINMALQVYLEHMHRQPLWLLEPDSATPLETNEELTCVVLALGITCCPTKFTRSDLQPPSFYASRASSLAMVQVARQEVSLQTIQCLGLLAFYNLISGDLHLAGLNISIARSVLHYFMQRKENSASASFIEQSKVFWSLAYLEAFYGTPTMGPSIPGHISHPRLSMMEQGDLSINGVPLPESFRLSETQSKYENLDDIWSQSMRFCSLWRETRVYVSKCIEGLSEAPWQPTSTYSQLCSRIVDIEEVWPRRLNYNTAKFQVRSPEEIQAHKSVWAPWLKVQVAYHAVHCVINHPFLHSLDGGKTICPTNTFWRDSFEKALRHCTWVSRLIRIAIEKGLQITDPFFAQAAGIAGSLHLYWMHARDDALRESASKNLRVCQDYITSMATYWPLCRSIENALNTLAASMNVSSNARGSEKSTITGPLSLMWTLLDISAPQFFNYPEGRSYQKAPWSGSFECRARLSDEEADADSDPRDLRESTARYASPPQWASSRLGDAEVTTANMEGPDPRYQERVDSGWPEPGIHGPIGFSQEDIILVDPTWGPLEYMMRAGETASGSLDPWDFGNL